VGWTAGPSSRKDGSPGPTGEAAPSGRPRPPRRRSRRPHLSRRPRRSGRCRGRSASGAPMGIVRAEIVAWVRTLGSAAVYATLIVHVRLPLARVEGQSMARPCRNQDRLIVNKAVYRLSAPRARRHRDALLPPQPGQVVREASSSRGRRHVKITGRPGLVNDLPLDDSYVRPRGYRSHDDWGPQTIPDGYYFVMGDHRNTVPTPATGAWCRSGTSSAACRFGGGRFRPPKFF